MYCKRTVGYLACLGNICDSYYPFKLYVGKGARELCMHKPFVDPYARDNVLVDS